MAGIYIHIPFCSQYCIYCDFYSTKMLGKRESFTKALITEIGQRANDFNKLGAAVNTIYFGGGTPSLLPPAALQSILHAISAQYNLGAAGGPAQNSDREVTLEVNPDDISEQYLQGLLQAGFNRMSMGIQSFHDDHLKWMNRRHSAAEAVKAFNLSRAAGFDNISIDLIFGFEGLSLQMWRENLSRAIELSPEHISAYQLSLEPGTKLYSSYKKGEYLQLKESLSYKQYSLLQEMLSRAGYVQYEISSFCKPGRESRHNSSYWNFTPYFGFGPSAHSFDGRRRFWNVSSLNTYLKAIEQGTGCSREEIISPKDRFNEYIMLSLRQIAGMDVSFINSEFEVPDEFYKSLALLIKRGDIIEKRGKLRVPPEKLFISDGIIRELFI
ncbi:MAG TPA: coproporphyrinogen III oxidase [Rikenellaceae bacterium]|nr:coproporphyrinogen III oxidase [Rikenellaceae bacterium]